MIPFMFLFVWCFVSAQGQLQSFAFVDNDRVGAFNTVKVDTINERILCLYKDSENNASKLQILGLDFSGNFLFRNVVNDSVDYFNDIEIKGDEMYVIFQRKDKLHISSLDESAEVINDVELCQGATTGYDVSVACDSDEHLNFAFYGARANHRKLHFGKFNSVDLSNPTIEIVDESSPNIGEYTDMVFDESFQRIVVSYFDNYNRSVKLAYPNETMIVDSVGDTGHLTSIDLDGSGGYFITYVDLSLGTYAGKLKIAHVDEDRHVTVRIINGPEAAYYSDLSVTKKNDINEIAVIVTDKTDGKAWLSIFYEDNFFNPEDSLQAHPLKEGLAGQTVSVHHAPGGIVYSIENFPNDCVVGGLTNQDLVFFGGNDEVSLAQQEEGPVVDNSFLLPNPVSRSSKFVLNKTFSSCEIFSLSGKLISKSKQTSQIIAPNETGLYFVKLSFGEEYFFVKKWVVN